MPRFFRFAILLVASVVGACACSTTRYVSAQEDIESVWKGKTYAEIVQVNGAPDREMSDGADGVILVYENVKTFSDTYGYTPGYYWYGPWSHTNTYSTEIRNEIDYIHFFVGTDKICYMVKSNLKKADGTEPNPGGTVAAVLGGAVAAALVTWAIVR